MFEYNTICLWFPCLPFEISFRDNPNFSTNPFAITKQKNNRQVLYSINNPAKSIGLHTGISLHEAHMLCADLRTEERCLDKELSFMTNQAQWSTQFTPRVSIEE